MPAEPEPRILGFISDWCDAILFPGAPRPLRYGCDPGSRIMALLWILVGVALSAQAVALIFWGRAAYLWIQGIEAAFASMLLVAWRVRFRERAPRATRWPPLAPLASLAAAAAARNFSV